MGLSLGIIFHATVETLRISFPAVWRSQRGTLTREFCDEKLRSWAAELLKEADVRVQVHGLSNLEQAEQSREEQSREEQSGDGRSHVKQSLGPFIVVSNHQSLYDIPLLIHALPLSLRMAAKKELFRTPIWGRAMLAAGFVKIDRSDRDKAYDALRKAGEQMCEEGISLNIAPEGTRSKDGTLGPFKRGAFELARITELPILPVTIVGAGAVHGSGASQVQRGKLVELFVHPIVPVTSDMDASSLRDHVREVIKSALP